MSAYKTPGLIHHPQTRRWFFCMQSDRSEGLHIRTDGHHHILVHSLAIDANEPQVNNFFSLSSGTYGLDAHPFRKSKVRLALRDKRENVIGVPCYFL